MTDYDDLIQGLLDMRTIDFTDTRVAMDAISAIQGLVAVVARLECDLGEARLYGEQQRDRAEKAEGGE